MAVKLSDIAARTGLGIPTVSQILNGTPGRSYRPDTRARVMAVAKKLGYRVNSSARAVRAGRFNAVAIVSSPSNGRSWATAQMLASIEAALRVHDLHLILTALDDATLTTETYVPKILRELLVDGVLFNYTHRIPQRLIDLIEANHLPVIWLNAMRQHDCVCVDDYRGFAQTTERLIEVGHRRIAYCGAVPETDRPQAYHGRLNRQDGYADAMRNAGLSPQLIPATDWCGDDHPLAAALRHDRPTALVCYSIREADQALYLLANAGLTVPRDVSLIAKSSEGGVPLPLPLTCLEVSENERATTAVDALRTKIGNPAARLQPRLVPLHLIDETASIRPCG